MARLSSLAEGGVEGVGRGEIMRHAPIPHALFRENRARLCGLLPPGALVIVHAADVPPTNGDGCLRGVPGSDLFYLSGVEQEESVLVLYPDAPDEKQREMLFLKETSEYLAVWEGHKLTKEGATEVSGVRQIHWLSEWPVFLRRLMCGAKVVYLNSNEHPRAVVEVESRDARLTRRLMREYPLHRYERLAPLLHELRPVKLAQEVELMKRACGITREGFLRVLGMVRPGVNECEVEAEFIHEFTRQRARFAYNPIIAAGANTCVLHYNDNERDCRKGDLLLLDVGANYANYSADMTRTIPVSGKFSKRQKQLYQAVLRVMRESIKGLRPGLLIKDWQAKAERLMQEELLTIGLLTTADIRKQNPDKPAVKRYFMHGLGHPLGLDVHDVSVTGAPLEAGWVMTVEPGIYVPEERIGIRLENNILITPDGVVDLMADIPVEVAEIESLMRG